MKNETLIEIGIDSIKAEPLDFSSMQRAKQKVLEDMGTVSVQGAGNRRVNFSRRRLLQGLGVGSVAAGIATLAAFPLSLVGPKTLFAEALAELKHGGIYFEVLQVGAEARPASAALRVSVNQKLWYAKDGRSRMEDEFGDISIMDKFGNLRLQLNSDKTAHASSASLFSRPTTFFDSWIDIVENHRYAKEVGRETIDGRDLVHFEVESRDPKLIFQVWVEFASKSISRVEFSDTRFQPVTLDGITIIPATRTIISNIRTQQNFDESLFSVTPPDGYTVTARS